MAGDFLQENKFFGTGENPQQVVIVFGLTPRDLSVCDRLALTCKGREGSPIIINDVNKQSSQNAMLVRSSPPRRFETLEDLMT